MRDITVNQHVISIPIRYSLNNHRESFFRQSQHFSWIAYEMWLKWINFENSWIWNETTFHTIFVKFLFRKFLKYHFRHLLFTIHILNIFVFFAIYNHNCTSKHLNHSLSILLRNLKKKLRNLMTRMSSYGIYESKGSTRSWLWSFRESFRLIEMKFKI